MQRTRAFARTWSLELATLAAAAVAGAGLPGLALLGAAWLLFLAPGWQAARWLGVVARRPLRAQGVAWVLALALSLAISPVVIYWTSLLAGFSRPVIALALAAIALLPSLLTRLSPVPLLSPSLPPSPFDRPRHRRLALALLALLAVLVTLTYLQVRVDGALYPPFISDYAKQHTVVDLIERSGVPPRLLLYPPWQEQPFVYPYFFHLVVASLRLLASPSPNILAAFTVTTVITALTFASLLAILARALTGRERPALLTLLFVTVVGGLDLVPLGAQGLANAARDGLTPQALLVSLGVDGWLDPAQRGGIGSFYHFYTWVPQHLAAGLVFALGVTLFALLGRSAARRLAILLPILLFALAGYSVYVAIPVLAALLLYATVDSGRALLAKTGAPQTNRRWRPLLAWLAIALASLLLAWPYLRDLWRIRGAETAGLALAVTSNGLDWLDGALVRQLFGPYAWAHLLDAPLYFLLELGALLVFGLWGWIVYARQMRNRHAQPAGQLDRAGWPEAGQVRPAARFLLLAGLVAAMMVLFVSSRGAVLGITWNDFRMRAILVTQIALASLAGFGLELAWSAASTPARTRLRRGLVVALLALGLAATAWDFTGLGLARFALDKQVPAGELAAYDFLRTATGQDAIVQGALGRDRSLHLYAERMSRVDAGMIAQMHVPNARLSADYAALQAALAGTDSQRAWQALRQLGVDYLFVGPEERQAFGGSPDAALPALDDATRFLPVYSSERYTVFQVAPP